MSEFGKWQPIETAPKDEPLLTAGTGWHEATPMIGVFDKHWGAWTEYDGGGFIEPPPTHWMPLPPPPEKST